MGKIAKLLMSLYDIEGNDFDSKLEWKYGIEYEWEGCDNCGSKAFYVRKAIAKKNLDQLEECGVETCVDLELICAECGSDTSGYVIDEKFSEELDKIDEDDREYAGFKDSKQTKLGGKTDGSKN